MIKLAGPANLGWSTALSRRAESCTSKKYTSLSSDRRDKTKFVICRPQKRTHIDLTFQQDKPKRCIFCSFYSRLRTQADLTSQSSRPKSCTFCSFYSRLRTQADLTSQPSRPKRGMFCSFYSRLRTQADLTSQPSRPKRCTFCSFYSKQRTKLGKANRRWQGKHINNSLGFTGRKRFYMPKLAGPQQ